MTSISWFNSLIGGAAIGVAASILLAFNGRVAGVSGIVTGLLRPHANDWAWRAAFVFGLLAAGTFMLTGAQTHTPGLSPARLLLLVPAGLITGFGARLGGGCTSGHGVCGLSRLSVRSLVATLTFIAAGALSVLLTRYFAGAQG